MPDKDEIKEEANNQETIKVVKANPPWPLITIGVFGTVVVVALMIGGWMFVRAHQQDQPGLAGGRMGMMSRSLPGGGQFGGECGGFRRGGVMLQSAAANGVVTALSGDTITISGQGKQVTVKKSTSTTISGDKTDVAVNDTVVVYGTTESDGTTVDATRILVRNLTDVQGTNNPSADSSDSMTPGV